MLPKKLMLLLTLSTVTPWIASEAQPLAPGVTKQWERHYPDADTSAHFVSCPILVDGAGSSYITGKMRTVGAAHGILTRKINSSGNEVWRAHYSTTDIPSAVALRMDSAGSLLVGMRIDGVSGGEWVRVSKFDHRGNSEWAATYAYPQDSALVNLQAMELAPSGEIYLTGLVTSPPDYDIRSSVLVKLDKSGGLQWVRVDSLVRTARTIAIDRNGDAYLCGTSDGTEFVIAKYSASGEFQWSRHFPPPSGVAGAFYEARESAVDSAGNVYVVGYGFSQAFGEAGSWVISYDSTGGLRWSSEYDTREFGSDEIRLRSDRVYVSNGQMIVSYSSTGVLRWSVAPRVDSVFVTSFQLVGDDGVLYAGTDVNIPERTCVGKYDNPGTKRWTQRIDGALPGYPTLGTDGSENAYVLLQNQLGSGHPEIVRFDAVGGITWMEPDCYGCVQQPVALGIDVSGNSYVTGWSHCVGKSDDFLTVKYDPSGVAAWAARYNGPADSTDHTRAIGVDRQGNVYVTGASQGKGTGSDYATIKYDRFGSQQWVARYNGPGFGDDIPVALAVDSLGYVYVTGSSLGSGTNLDYATVKYTPDGLLQWVARYNSGANGVDRAQAIAVDPQGNVYVAGSSDSTGTNADYLTVKYNELGQPQWTARYNGSPGGVDWLQGMAIDSAGNVVVTGWSDGIGTQTDYATVKYSSAGVPQWVARYDDPASSFDFAYAFALDRQGNVYVTGSSNAAGTNEDYTTVKYDASGIQQWVAIYDGPAHEVDDPTNIGVDPQGNVYVAGHSGRSGGSEAATVKYDGNGVQQWVVRYNDGQMPPNETPVGLALDGASGVLLADVSGYAGGTIWTTLKYTQEPTVSVAQQRMSGAVSYRLDQNYPNPFNPITRIKYTVGGNRAGGIGSSDVSLIVYDVLGREVAVLVNERKPPGSYEVRFDALGLSSGVYFYRLQAGGFVDTKKLILIH